MKIRQFIVPVVLTSALLTSVAAMVQPNTSAEAKIVEITVRVDSDGVHVTSHTGLSVSSDGWVVRIRASEEQKAVFKLRGEDADSQGHIVEVRSDCQGDLCGPDAIIWDYDGGDYVSPAYAVGAEFVIRLTVTVNTSTSTHIVPQGGDYFRVLDQGA